MSPSKPLSYEPLKSVLAHIEANKRFEISLKMPTIRKTEKLVPLKIDKLAFSIQLAVNRTVHGVKIVEKKDCKPNGYISYKPEYICLTRDGIISEYVEYSRAQFQHAPIYLMKSFFGGRSYPILVKHLLFDALQILEFPQNAKFRIKNLTIQNGIRKSLRKLSAVLTSSSFPLQSLEVFVDHSTDEEFRDEIVQETRKVIVHNSYLTFTIGAENWNFLPANTHFGSTLRVNTIPIKQSSEVHVSVRDYDGSEDNDDPPTSMLVLEVVAKM